jgi:PAS domain S-box-containing protein
MKISNLKVRTRLIAGFSILIVMSLCIGVFAMRELGHLNETVHQLTSEDWDTIQGATNLRSKIRTVSAKSTELLLEEADKRDTVRGQLDEARSQIDAEFEKMSHLDTDNPDAMNGLKALHESYSPMTASVDKVLALAGNPKTNADAVHLYMSETRPLVDAALKEAADLVKVHTADVMESAEETRARYSASIKFIYGILGGALALGLFIAIYLARGIVRPLGAAMSVAEAIRDGKLNNAIDTAGKDETGRLLSTLDDMQAALIKRDEKDMDYRGQIAAIGRAQAVIEFGMDGTVRDVNENFAQVMGYRREEVIGKHHGQLVEPGYATSAEYRNFWAKLNRGESHVGIYKRIAKGGREVWITASYNPIPDASGKPFKVVKYASDVTAQTARNADFEGQLAAINASQAVIEFDMDGTVRKINDNFARVMGYSPAEVVGKHHSHFVDPAMVASPDYRAFWAKLGRGDYEAGTFKRLAKGGREVWLTASYSPIKDANGKPFKVVKFATDVTAATQVSQQLEVTVRQTQTTVRQAIDGDLTQRIPLDGKTGTSKSCAAASTRCSRPRPSS